jgi:hypothetical protein
VNVSQGRGARRVALAFALLLVSVLGHSAAAGSLPALTGLLGAAAVSTALAFAVADRRRSALWLFGYLLAGQVLLHVVMSAMGHHAFALIPDTPMLAAHIAAAGVAAVLFAKSEALAMRWMAAARRILGAPALVLPEVQAEASVPVLQHPVSWRDALCMSAASGRAPPVSV